MSKYLFLLAIFAPLAWGEAEELLRSSSQVYGVINEIEFTNQLVCDKNRGFVALNDDNGLWAGTVVMQYLDPQSGWQQLSSTSTWSADTGLVPWNAIAEGVQVPIRLISDNASINVSFWLACDKS